MTSLSPIHPGEILGAEFLEPLGLNASQFARVINVPSNRISRLIAGRSSVTPDTALRLAKALSTTPDFWMNLQMRFDLLTAQDGDIGLDDIKPVIAA